MNNQFILLTIKDCSTGQFTTSLIEWPHFLLWVGSSLVIAGMLMTFATRNHGSRFWISQLLVSGGIFVGAVPGINQLSALITPLISCTQPKTNAPFYNLLPALDILTAFVVCIAFFSTLILILKIQLERSKILETSLKNMMDKR